MEQLKAEAKAKGIKDGFLVVLFTILSFAAIQLLTWALSLLPMLHTFKGGEYSWLEPLLALLIGSIIKGIDRKKHEDPTDPATGLVKI